MSMRTTTVTGFGIDELLLEEAEMNNKVMFIKEFLPALYNKMMEDYHSEDDFYDFAEEWIRDYQDDNGMIGFGAIFAMAINENEKDFEVESFCGEYGDENAVMYLERLPWEMSERVKRMSANDMKEVFYKYMNILGVKGNVRRLTVEFFG